MLCLWTLLLVPACEKKPLTAELETSKGTMIIELYPDDAPKTVENFVGLAKQGYYDGLTFHRIAKGFVIQTGDSLGTGEGGRSIYGAEFADELDPGTASYQAGYLRGVVAMANRGPNTNLSQFFVLLRDAPSLQKNYTIFGKVVKGMEVADSIEAVEIVPVLGPGDGKPKTNVVLRRVTIVE
jgi:cyclophilin family peptidyl-prolyl cis-trans isomerase